MLFGLSNDEKYMDQFASESFGFDQLNRLGMPFDISVQSHSAPVRIDMELGKGVLHLSHYLLLLFLVKFLHDILLAQEVGSLELSIVNSEELVENCTVRTASPGLTSGVSDMSEIASLGNRTVH